MIRPRKIRVTAAIWTTTLIELIRLVGSFIQIRITSIPAKIVPVIIVALSTSIISSLITTLQNKEVTIRLCYDYEIVAYSIVFLILIFPAKVK
jgi:hypothetical protein